MHVPPTAAPRTLHVAIAVVFFTNGLAFASWAARIPEVRAALAIGEGALGLALFAMGLGALAAFGPAGRLVARRGARAVTLAAGLACCVTLPPPVFAPTLVLLALALFAFGAASGAMDVAMNALAVEVEARLARPIMSGLHGAWSAGALAGAALGSGMAQLGVAPRMHLLGVALVLLAALAAARRALPPAPPPPPGPPAPRCALPERGLLALGAAIFCAFLVEGAMADWGALYLRDGLGTTTAQAALGYAAFAFAMLAMRLAGDRLRRAGVVGPCLRVAALAAALLLGWALVVQQAAATVLAYVAVALAIAVVAPQVFAAAAARSRRGPGQGIAAMATLGYGGFLLGPPLIGALAQATDLRLALALPAALLLVLAVLAPRLAPERGPAR